MLQTCSKLVGCDNSGGYVFKLGQIRGRTFQKGFLRCHRYAKASLLSIKRRYIVKVVVGIFYRVLVVRFSLFTKRYDGSRVRFFCNNCIVFKRRQILKFVGSRITGPLLWESKYTFTNRFHNYFMRASNFV